MAEQYGFKAKKCQCGQGLIGVKVEIAGFWRGKTPMGNCPKCGRGLPLDVPVPEPEEVPEPVEVAAKAPVKSKSKK